MRRLNKEQLREMLHDYHKQYEVVELHNQAIDYLGYSLDDLIYTMDDFLTELDTVWNFKPSEVIDRVFYGSFNPNHLFARFNGYANFESTMYADEFVDLDAIIQYIDEEGGLV